MSETYTQDQLRETGVMAFITFSGAVPQKTTFQIRWTNDNGTYHSPVRAFEREEDSIRLNLGKELPPGRHVIEFLVDGVVLRNASITVQASPKKQRALASKKKTPSEPPVLETTISVLAPEEVPAIPAPAVHEEAPPRKPEPEVRTEPPEPEPIPVVTYTAKHWHNIGSCSGEIKLTPQNIEFTSGQHTFKFGIYQIQLDGDGFRDPSGRAWHFFIQGVDVERMLGKWQNGGLFTNASQDETAAAFSAGESRKPKSRTYPAKHKHRLGRSCSGELTLTADALEFSSKQHYVKSYVTSTQIEGDGILDRGGQSWRFDIQGEDAGSLLRSWKDGTLFEASPPPSK